MSDLMIPVSRQQLEYWQKRCVQGAAANVAVMIANLIEGYDKTKTAEAQQLEFKPQLLGYDDCRCILAQYCDGKCRPIFSKPPTE